MKFFNKPLNKIWFGIGIILFLVNLIVIVQFTPMIRDQHWAQKIFYIHVPVAWSGFLSYFIVMIAGILFLSKKDFYYDRLGQAAAELGTLFTSLVLITGPIWATPIWGKPWIWEPRLTTTLILFLIYIGYFMLREFGGHPERVSRYAAVLGIIAFIDVPIIFFSVKFWSPEIQSHPQVKMSSQSSGILQPFFFSLAVFTILLVLMLRYRTYVLGLKVKGESHV